MGHFGDDVFLVMELIEGVTLRAWLRGGKRSWRDVLRLYLEAARGLVAVHFAGLVHGDFKPENVLLGADGPVRIVDFGLSRAGESPSSNGVGGTPRYMAPELRAGGFPSRRSDQYSFCVALVEAFLAVAARPRGAFRLLVRGLADDPHRRHPSMEALRRALQRGLEARRRWFLGAATGLALLLLGVAVAMVARTAEANRTRAEALRLAALEASFEQGRREWQAGHPAGALVYLSAALEGGLDRPGVRFLLARAVSALEETSVEMSVHDAPVTAVLFAPLGPTAVVATQAGTVRQFAGDGKLLVAFDAHAGRIHSLALDEDDRRLLTTGEDGRVRMWDLATGTLLEELAGHDRGVLGARFLRDGSVLSHGKDGTARLWIPARNGGASSTAPR